jgi:hypothetical protein
MKKKFYSGHEFTTSITNKAFQPLIDFCHANRGAITRLKKRFDHVTGREWRRHNFERWLHPDPDSRVEPSYGSGVLLVAIGKEIMENQSEARHKRSSLPAVKLNGRRVSTPRNQVAMPVSTNRQPSRYSMRGS